MHGYEVQIVINTIACESPNGTASLAELVGLSGRIGDAEIVLTTPAEKIVFEVE